jgi:hypothetical protein
MSVSLEKRGFAECGVRRGKEKGPARAGPFRFDLV